MDSIQIPKLQDVFMTLVLCFDHTFIMLYKNSKQVFRRIRFTINETFIVPLIWIAIVGGLYAAIISQGLNQADAKYDVRSLPLLNEDGVFNKFSVYSAFKYGENLLMYSPNNHQGVNDLMETLQAENPYLRLKGVASADDINDAYQNNLFKAWAAVDFDLDEEQIAKDSFVNTTTPVKYTMRFVPNYVYGGVSTDFYNNEDIYNNEGIPPVDWSIATGYLTLQNFIRTYITAESSGLPRNEIEVPTFVQRYPKSSIYPKNADSSYPFYRLAIWRWMAAFVLTVAVLIPMLQPLVNIVREKEMRMFDLLEISGLLRIAYYVSSMITIISLAVCTWTVVVSMCSAFNIIGDFHVKPYYSLGIAYIAQLAAASIAFGYVIPTSEYYGLPVFIISIILSVVGTFAAVNFEIDIAVKLLMSFLAPPLALNVGVFTIESYLYDNPDQSMDYGFVNTEYNKPSLRAVLFVQLLSICFYIFIAWGMPFDWMGSILPPSSIKSLQHDGVADRFYRCDTEEAEKEDLRPVLLDVQSLYHIYPDGTKAVKNISFQVHEGETLSFLGANGAGKSTTMNMLCGTLQTTSGDAYINGYSIARRLTQARRNLGICTQQDVLWDDITLREHLYIFSTLRGCRSTKATEEIFNMIESLGLPEKADSLAGTLSGGQKRRLCAGISMVGGNKVVYLDEPTAGLDPVSRRQLWELVEKNRKGRAILLTTHFMDEADVLGDKIAIVKNGRLRCLGSARFLKKNFGLGFHLRCSISESRRVGNILDEIKRIVPDAAVTSNAGTELAIRLNKEAASSFPALFERLESMKSNLGISSYGIETTTLEEVFMRIINEDDEMELLHREDSNNSIGSGQEEYRKTNELLTERDNKRNPLTEANMNALLTAGSGKVGDTAGLSMQVRSLLLKRYYQFVRSKGQLILGFVVTTGLATLLAYMFQVMPDEILADDPVPTTIEFIPTLTTLIAGPVNLATQWATEALPIGTVLDYVGTSYESLYQYIANVSSNAMVYGGGNTSTDGLVFDSSQYNFTVMYNASYPLNFLGMISSAVDESLTRLTQASGVGTVSFQETCKNLPISLLDGQFNTFGYGSCLLAVYGGSIATGFAVVLGEERISGVKHQQLASGASKTAYWMANFIFDFSITLFNIFIMGVLFSAFAPRYYTEDGFVNVIVAGVIYGLASVPRFYCASFFVDDVKMAQSLFFYWSLFAMFVWCNIWINIVITGGGNDPASSTAIQMTTILSFFDPMFGFSAFMLYQHNFLAAKSSNGDADIFYMRLLGMVVMIMVIGCVAYWLGVMYFESGGCGYSSCNCCASGNRYPSYLSNNGTKKGKKHLSLSNTDPDVLNEKQRVNDICSGKGVRGADKVASATIVINEANKVYPGRGTIPTKMAVKDVSFSVGKGEIFGLLGANGAGKTTLLKIVSGLENPTAGSAIINGFDIQWDRRQAQRSMGLCPQFDTLVGSLSVRENLLFFGRLKGINEGGLIRVVESYMDALDIAQYQHKLTQNLSGGNRRKVSLAVALMGCPPSVYLDEPSTGLDPVASRLMWRLLSRISSTKSSAIILTTHNMLECEAVCTRICMMKQGELVCIGDSQHLRGVHGAGYLLEIALNSISDIDRAMAFVLTNFPNAYTIDEHTTMLNFEIPRGDIPSLATAFRLLEENKVGLNIVDYSLSQSTLEQVFLKQIREKETDTDFSSVFEKPNSKDYLYGYLSLLVSTLLPGYHHFKFGNFWRGMMYLFTLNILYTGLCLDIFEMHVLLGQSVQEHGHLTAPLSSICRLCAFISSCCSCFNRWCCCCCRKKTNDVQEVEDTSNTSNPFQVQHDNAIYPNSGTSTLSSTDEAGLPAWAREP